MILLNKYEDLLNDFMSLMEDIDDEIVLRGYDLAKLEENLQKAKNEA